MRLDIAWLFSNLLILEDLTFHAISYKISSFSTPGLSLIFIMEKEQRKDIDLCYKQNLYHFRRKSRTRGSISGEEMEVNIPVMEDILGNQSVLQELSSVMEEKEIPITPGPLPVMTTPTAEDLLR